MKTLATTTTANPATPATVSTTRPGGVSGDRRGDRVRSAISTEAMLNVRRRDSAAKRAQVLAALRAMLADGEPITATALARRAQVSTWLVYAPGIRDVVENARAQQHHPTGPDHAPRSPPHGDPAVVGALRTDLALARAEITRLRADRTQHTEQLRRALGTQLDTRTKADLVARIDELTRTNTELTTATTRHEATIHTLHERITTLKDDLAAARTSLRRMIRAENLPPTP